ncbi:MAG TPA: GNAT family N-acetyltransferase [Blastocatellia bacterium]|nr:GNAT family N-acetyltransferase [Blastocatellia bacterium]
MQAIVRQPVAPPAAPAPVVVEVFTGSADVIEPLAAEWRALCAEGACDQPFFRPEWIRTYLRAFAVDKTLLLVTVRRNGSLRAVLPLIEERASLHGLPVRKLRSAANVHSCRFDLIHGTTDRAAAIQAIWTWLKQQTTWDVIELEDVPEGGAGEALTQTAAADGYLHGRWEKPAGRALALPNAAGTTVQETVQKLLRSSLRKSLRRERRRLTAQGSLQLVCLNEYQAKPLEDFYQLERAGWKGKSDTAIACAASTRQFYDEVAQAATQHGYFTLYSLLLNDRPIAQQYCLTYHGCCYLLKPTYDEEFSQYSPGGLLLEDVVSDLVARGFRGYDFLSPPSFWKDRWANVQSAQSSWYIFCGGRRRFIGQALYAWKFQVASRARQVKQQIQQKLKPNSQAGSTQGADS